MGNIGLAEFLNPIKVLMEGIPVRYNLIARLGGRSKVVRVSQLSRALKVKMPSVTSALKKLSEQGLVEHLFLTESMAAA